MKLITDGRPVIPEHHEEDPYSILGLSTGIRKNHRMGKPWIKCVEEKFKQLCLTFHPDRLIRWNFSPQEAAPFIKFFDLMNKAKETLVNKKMYKEFKDRGVFNPPTEQTIIGAANTQLDMLFCKVCREVRDEQHNDFIEIMRKSVTIDIDKFSGEIENAGAEIKRMREIKKRTHSPVFKGISQKIVENLIEQTRNIEKSLLVYKKMIELLKDCSYDFDAPAGLSFSFTLGGSSSATA